MSGHIKNWTPVNQGLCCLPPELLTQITEYLEPELEDHLDPRLCTVVAPRLGLPFGRVSIPTIQMLRSGGGPLAWGSYDDMKSVRATCKQLYNHPNLYRTVVLHTSVQLVLFFKAILDDPTRMTQVRHLQIHQYAFLPNDEPACRSKLLEVKTETRWDILHIASEIFRRAGNGSAAAASNSPTVVLSKALLHLLPKVETLSLPYPRSQFLPKYQTKSLDFVSKLIEERAQVQLISIAAGHRPLGSPALSLPVHAVESGRLKKLQLNAIAHFRRKQVTQAGRWTDKMSHPFQYWNALFSGEVFQSLLSLELQRIGDPLPKTFPHGLPQLKTLKLHSLNMDEDQLISMLVTVPSLTTLEVWFTMPKRKEAISTLKQANLDAAFPKFPAELRSLTLGYLSDMKPTPNCYWTPTITPRLRLTNLNKLTSVEILAIDISSLVSHPAEPGCRLAPLPPKLRHLKVLSSTGISTWDLQSQAGISDEQQINNIYDSLFLIQQLPIHSVEPIEHDFLYYVRLLGELMLCLGPYWSRSPGEGLRRIDLVRPLFCDQLLHESKTSADVRRSFRWSDRMIGLSSQYESQVLNCLKITADRLREDFGVDARVEYSWVAQTGGDRLMWRDEPMFWMRE